MNTEKPCDGQIVETKMMRKILKVVREKKRGGYYMQFISIRMSANF